MLDTWSRHHRLLVRECWGHKLLLQHPPREKVNTHQEKGKESSQACWQDRGTVLKSSQDSLPRKLKFVGDTKVIGASVKTPLASGPTGRAGPTKPEVPPSGSTGSGHRRQGRQIRGLTELKSMKEC